MRKLQYCTIWIVLLSLTGCQRFSRDGLSTLTIQVPKDAHLNSKTGGVRSLAAMPSDRVACYGINITGADIETQAGTCGPKSGILAGFVKAGETIEVTVKTGKDRKVELYAYLQPTGVDQPCPQMAANLASSQLLNSYLIASAERVDMSAEVTVVELTMNFPGVANHLAAELSLPTACTGQSQPTNQPIFNVSSGRGVASGGGILLVGGLGKSASSEVASGAGIKLFRK